MTTHATGVTLHSDRVTLRAAVESDKADRRKHGRDPEFFRMVGGDPADFGPLTEEDVEKWYRQHSEREHHWSIVVEGRCIGGVGLSHLDAHNRRAHHNIGIFDRSVWGNGIGTEVTKLGLKYAFEHLELHRVETKALDFNHRAISAYKKAGFVHEGTEREDSLFGGKRCTDMHMGILEQEYRGQSREMKSEG